MYFLVYIVNPVDGHVPHSFPWVPLVVFFLPVVSFCSCKFSPAIVFKRGVLSKFQVNIRIWRNYLTIIIHKNTKVLRLVVILMLVSVVSCSLIESDCNPEVTAK